MGLLLVLLNTSVSAAQDATPGILITEVLAANTRTVADDQGRYSDWIELHNPTTTPVSLAGYTLTDDPTEPTKWRLPFTTLAPGAFLVVWASGEDRATSAGWHTNFRLSGSGEYVGLFGPDGQVVDEVTFGEQEADVSLGRLDGADQWVAFPTPPPGAANTTRPRAVPGAPPVTVTPGSGRFVGPVAVQLETPLPESTVYYTLDGSDPTVAGRAYTAPVVLEQTGFLRAVALRDRVPVSVVTTAMYLLGDSTGLPVLSLVTEPAHLWDEETGIYVNAGERGRKWERPVTVEWLSPEGELGFSVRAGLRIHGAGTRTLTDKRSFRLYFRGEYGPRELEYPLFGAEPGQAYDRLVLLTKVNDGWLCNEVPDSECQGGDAVYVRDQLVRDLHGAMGQVVARGRWMELYLNGGPWGLYNLTERIDETFLATHFDHDYWDLTHSEEHTAWDAFVDWITGTDLSATAQYELALRQLDIENFTSFIILWLWSGDIESNWYAARMRYGPDTRWQLFAWDAEITLGLKGIPSVQGVIGSGARGPLTSILASLLASPQYQAYFTAQVERHLAGALATESVRSRLATLVTELRPAIAAEAARWLPDREPAVMVAQWEAAMQRVSDSLDISEQRLRQLSDLETFRQLLPQLPVSDDPAALPPLPPGTRIALLVHHPAELTEGDTAVVAHLATRGVTVNVIGTHDDGTHDAGLVASSHDLLLLSSSIRLLDLAVRYFQPTTPLIFWEPQLLAAMRVPLSPWGGTRPEQTDIRIVDADHPITTGLSAEQPLRVVSRPDTLSVAYPPHGPGVQVLARHLTGDDAALMVAEAGAELAHGQQAQARTVFWFWHHDTFRRSTDAAVRLFDRAVDWALGLPADTGT